MFSKIKIIIAAAVTVTVIVLSIQIYLLNNKNDSLTRQLAKSKIESAMRKNILDQLNADRAYMNNLLIQRANTASEKERELNEDINFLKSKLEDIQCRIPQSVTERLRSAY